MDKLLPVLNFVDVVIGFLTALTIVFGWLALSVYFGTLEVNVNDMKKEESLTFLVDPEHWLSKPFIMLRVRKKSIPYDGKDNDIYERTTKERR